MLLLPRLVKSVFWTFVDALDVLEGFANMRMSSPCAPVLLLPRSVKSVFWTFVDALDVLEGFADMRMSSPCALWSLGLVPG